MVQLRSMSFTPFKNTPPSRSISSVVSPQFGEKTDKEKVKGIVIGEDYLVDQRGLARLLNVKWARLLKLGNGNLFYILHNGIKNKNKANPSLTNGGGSTTPEWFKWLIGKK